MSTKKLPHEILADLVKDKGWSQAELGRRSGHNRSTINSVFMGNRNIGKDLGLDFARAFDMTPDLFFRTLGLFPDNVGEDNDDTLNQIKYLYSKLRTKESKDKALEFIHFLKESEKKKKQ